MDVGECGSSAVTSSKQQSLTDIAVLRLIRHLMQFSWILFAISSMASFSFFAQNQDSQFVVEPYGLQSCKNRACLICRLVVTKPGFSHLCSLYYSILVLWQCRLGVRKSEWWGAFVLTLLERGAQFAYGPADATTTQSSLASLESKMVLPFWYQLTRVILEKRPLNGVFLSVLMVCFCCVMFSFFNCKPRDWLGTTFPKWSACILCPFGCKT